MAFNERRIFPNDQRPSVAIGFNLPMNEGGVYTPNFQTKDAIKYNLINYFLTNPGEGPGNPLFGAGLRNFIFTQIDEQDFSFIEDDIQTKINEFFPDIIVENLDVLKTVESNTIQINLSYSVVDTGINDNLNLSFN